MSCEFWRYLVYIFITFSILMSIISYNTLELGKTIANIDEATRISNHRNR